MNFALLTEFWWFIKVGAAIFGAGWWLRKQVTRIVSAVSAVPELKRATRLHAKQINALAFAGKTAATVTFFPTNPPSKAEHLRVIEEFDKIKHMNIEEDK